MKKHYFILSILILIMSCSKDEASTETEVIEQEEVNLAPNDFNITISNLSHSSVTINWSEATDPEGEIISYTIYLDGKLVAANISGFGHQLMNLTELTNYSGKVVAKDSNNNETSKTFSFITEKYYLKFKKAFNLGIADYAPGYYNTGYPYSMIKTIDNNYIIAGKSSRPDGNGFQFFILKNDYEGNLIWEKFYDYQLGDADNFKIAESSNGLILAGNHHVLNLDHDGNLIWYKKIDSFEITDGYAEIKSAKQDSKGNIFIVGGRDSSDSSTVREGVVVKLDNFGNLLWEKTYHPSILNFLNDLFINSSDELIIIGTSETSGVTYEEYIERLVLVEQIDFWILKLTSEGQIIWQNTFGDLKNEIANQIISTNDNNFVVSGREGSIFKINTSGNLVWGNTDLPPISYRYSVAETIDNGYITTGYNYFGNYGGLAISKYDSNGNSEWTKIFQIPFTYLGGFSILSENDGGYRFTGSSGKTYYYNDEKPETLIYKTDPEGNYE